MRFINKLNDKQPLIIAIFIVVILLLTVFIVGITAHNKEISAKKKAQAEMAKNARKLYAEGNYEKMIKDLNVYLKKNPEDYEAHALLSSAYIVTGKVPEAYEETKKLYEHKTNPDIAYQLGILADKMGKKDEAIGYLRACVKAKPNSLPFHTALGDLYFKYKKYNEAIHEWDTLLKILPKDSPLKPEVYNKLANAYNALGNPARANELLKEAASR
ncbi:MAG: tetratricopeptide repeat protein [Firmicutes bacterium]|nr:tetratricopeptide repeat protein [Bacillota bacterium]